MALKWIQANIHLLGGDPGRVNILGQFEGSWLAGRVTGLPIKKKIKLRALYIFHLKGLGHEIRIVFNI
jgi:carboxylesterase type B